ERVGSVGGGGRPSQGPIECAKIRHGPTRNGQVELERTEALPFSRGPAGVPLVEPEWNPHSHLLMQGEMGKLVSQSLEQITRIGTEEKRVRVGNCDGCSQGGGAAAGERIEPPTIRYHDQTDRSGGHCPQSRP